MYAGKGPIVHTNVIADWFATVPGSQSEIPDYICMVERETGKSADVRTWVSTPWVWPGISEITLPSTRHV